MGGGGSKNGAFLSEEAQCGGIHYWGPRKMLRKATDTGISLHRGAFMSEGNLESGRGFIYQEL